MFPALNSLESWYIAGTDSLGGGWLMTLNIWLNFSQGIIFQPCAVMYRRHRLDESEVQNLGSCIAEADRFFGMYSDNPEDSRTGRELVFSPRRHAAGRPYGMSGQEIRTTVWS